MTPQEAKELLTKYHEGNCTPEEKTLIEHWYLKESSSQQLPADTGDLNGTKSDIWNAICETSGLQDNRKRRRQSVQRIAVAAAIIFIMSAGLYFYKQNPILQSIKEEIVHVKKNDVEPGGDKAVLTLADGSKITLDDTGNGLIATQAGIIINKLSDGTLAYKISENASNNHTVTYNTIETPKGGKYQIILPDGSKVWLNAASSLRFPTSFTGKERKVELNGEAYFEVSKNKLLPFQVRADDMSVYVTGTQFNVMAYKDESYTATTLVEGSVDVKNTSQNLSLIPGEQAVIKPGAAMSKKEVDVEQAIAWKNGLFQFDNSDIQSVMRQIGRWYDISVEYRGRIPSNRFGGYISRDLKLSQVIKMLEISGVKFSIENKKIIVLP